MIVRILSENSKVIKEFNLENYEGLEEYILYDISRIKCSLDNNKELETALEILPSEAEVEYIIKECKKREIDIMYIKGIMDAYIEDCKDTLYWKIEASGYREYVRKKYSNINDILEIIILFANKGVDNLETYYSYEYEFLFYTGNALSSLSDLKNVLSIVFKKGNQNWGLGYINSFRGICLYYDVIKEEILLSLKEML